MTLGQKLGRLRKEKRLSQEQVAEHLDVTRQTISNWELDITTPDLNQAKRLSEFYQISLDELVENNLEMILTSKITSTEKLAKMIILILKGIGILVTILLLGMIIYFGVSSFKKTSQMLEAVCILDDQVSTMYVTYEDGGIIMVEGNSLIVDFYQKGVLGSTVVETQLYLSHYFESEHGKCVYHVTTDR